MTTTEATARLRAAELELQRTQLEPPGSLRANERYRAAAAELAIAEAVAAAVLSAA